jgi:hypothetical protein
MNITFALDAELIAAAKVVAAKRDTSISALVRLALESQVALDAQTLSSCSSGALQLLVDYSMGARPRGVVMDLLGVDDYGVLLDLLSSAGLPHPLVPLKTRKAMTASMLAVIGSGA